MDAQIIERFKKFQDTDAGAEYRDLRIEEVELVPLSFKNKAFSFVKGQNKYVRKYVNFNAGEIPVLGASLNNSCIYSHVTPIDKKDIITQPSVSFNKDNAKGSRAFLRDYPYVMDRHHICIIPNTEIVSAEYLHVFLDSFLELKNYGWGTNVASAGEVKSHSIVIPKNLNKKYTSLKIQDALVAFIEHYQDDNNRKLETLRKIEALADKAQNIVVPLFFKRDSSAVEKFNIFCSQHGVNLKLEEIEFDKKRIISDNPKEVICKKRMGFTPKTSPTGDINWFSITDLSDESNFFISDPDTRKKTTMDLVRKKISENSSKYKPIKQGDVLISFKLTVGLTKIYDSTKPAYCNEAIDILTADKSILPIFLAYNCMVEYKRYAEKTNNGYTLNDSLKEKITINVPKSQNGYTSKQIQEKIVVWTENYMTEKQKLKEIINNLTTLLPQHTQLLIYKTFKG